MSSVFPMLSNIRNQPAALEAVLNRQLGEGRAAMERCARILSRARQIVVSGMGASHFAAMTFPARAIETSELLYFESTRLLPDTAVVLVSRSGESVEIVRAVEALKARGIPTVGIVNVPDSRLAHAADAALFVGSEADQIIAVQTYTSTVFALALLHATVEGTLENRAAQAREIPKIAERWIGDCERDPRWNAPHPGPPFYFLGRGLSMAAVEESVLLMHETAKSPAVGMPAAQFRHGPVEAVAPGFRAVVFANQSETQPLDLGLASDLTNLGGSVATVETPLGPPWSAVLEIMPSQILAYYYALVSGVRPGDFRVASHITLTEVGFGSPAASQP